jgi:hypothetical protein
LGIITYTFVESRNRHEPQIYLSGIAPLSLSLSGIVVNSADAETKSDCMLGSCYRGSTLNYGGGSATYGQTNWLSGIKYVSVTLNNEFGVGSVSANAQSASYGCSAHTGNNVLFYTCP